MEGDDDGILNTERGLLLVEDNLETEAPMVTEHRLLTAMDDEDDVDDGNGKINLSQAIIEEGEADNEAIVLEIEEEKKSNAPVSQNSRPGSKRKIKVIPKLSSEVIEESALRS